MAPTFSFSASIQTLPPSTVSPDYSQLFPSHVLCNTAFNASACSTVLITFRLFIPEFRASSWLAAHPRHSTANIRGSPSAASRILCGTPLPGPLSSARRRYDCGDDAEKHSRSLSSFSVFPSTFGLSCSFEYRPQLPARLGGLVRRMSSP